MRVNLFNLFFVSLLVGGFISTEAKASEYGKCTFTVTNNTKRTIKQLYIVPSAAEKSHPYWKIRHLNSPLEVGKSRLVTIQTTPNAIYWNAIGVLNNEKWYALEVDNPMYRYNEDRGVIFVMGQPCDASKGLNFGNALPFNWAKVQE